MISQQVSRPQFPYASLPPTLFNVAKEIHGHFPAPWELIISGLLTSMSVACQARLRVRLPHGKRVPVGLNSIALAFAAEGKSTIDEMTMKPNRAFAKTFNDERKAERKKAEFDLEIWQVKLDALISVLKNAAAKGHPTQTAETALAAHMSKKPRLPKMLKLETSDATREAIMRDLSTNIASGALISSEGSVVTSGHASRDLALLNNLYDGATISNDRVSSDPIEVVDPSFSLSIMIQPEKFREFIQRQGKHARDIGFLARCLICYPDSTQGTRFRYDIPDASLPNLADFHARLTCILQETYDHGDADKITLSLSNDAKVAALDFYNYLEGHMGPGGVYSDVRDAASKTPEKVVRMAALFHHYSGSTGEIQVETYLQARDICAWFLNEFKLLFGKPPEVPVEQVYAAELYHWIVGRIKSSRNFGAWTRNHIMQYGPNGLRKSDRLNMALSSLERSGYISVFFDGKRTCVQPNQQHFEGVIGAA